MKGKHATLHKKVTFKVRLPDFKQEITFRDKEVGTTTVRQIEFWLCEKLGLDPMSTVFRIAFQHEREALFQADTLFKAEIDQGDVLIAHVESTSKTLGKIEKAKVNEYLPDEEIKDYYMGYKYLSFGMTVEGLCLNTRCTNYRKELAVPVGSGIFDFMKMRKEIKCVCCPYKDRSLQPPIEITNLRFSNCKWRYWGHYKGDKRREYDNKKEWYEVLGEDAETFEEIVAGKEWEALTVEVQRY